jgi:hypothetical protein
METYNQAIADVEAGGAAWRTSWTNSQYIALNGTAIWYYSPKGNFVYNASSEDQQATDWNHSDRPPRP